MRFITAKEVAKILGVNESTVRINAAKGRLGFRHIKVGSLWKFPEDEVYEYVYGKNWREFCAMTQAVDTSGITEAANEDRDVPVAGADEI